MRMNGNKKDKRIKNSFANKELIKSSEIDTNNTNISNMEVITMEIMVKGMMCMHCEKSVKKKVKK